MGNLGQYRRAFESSLAIDISAFDGDIAYGSIEQWDSMAHIALISELEDVFDVMFEPDDILHFGSYLNGIAILKRYGIEF